jgi:hypothetical protein
MTKIILEFTTTNGIETLAYQLADNPIAKKWLEKISHLQHVPVDRSTTSDVMEFRSYQEYKTRLDFIINWINTNTHLSLAQQEHYTQEDLCVLHDHYLDLMKDPRYDWQSLVHEFNTVIHCCEHALHQHVINHFKISWGGNDGPYMEKFQQCPYNYYTENIVPGNLYLYWAEQGKTPGEYFYNQDPDNLANFLKTTVPHQQFSGFCILQIGSRYNIGTKFWQWFSKYKQAFVDKWHLDDWTSLHQNGAIELATLLNPIEEFNTLKKNFKKFERIYIDHEQR